jgi:hypothetical protein
MVALVTHPPHFRLAATLDGVKNGRHDEAAEALAVQFTEASKQCHQCTPGLKSGDWHSP